MRFKIWLNLRRPIRFSVAFLIFAYYKIFRSSRKFVFCQKSYPYFYHMYNFTFLAERIVEIPIFWEVVKKHQGKKILEVGNVLSHYFPVTHDIVDKDEKAPGVINQDIVEFKPGKRYDLIFAISTLEHVGWDEHPREPKEIFKALTNLKRLLAPGGKIILSLPLGYNRYVDKLLAERKLGLGKSYYLKRISRDTFLKRTSLDNAWKQVSWDEVKNVKYSHPFGCANGLVIGVIEKK